MGNLRKAGEKRRILAAALGFVATTGVFGAFGTFATFENRALFGEETAANRPIVAKPKDDALATPTGFKAFLVGADDYADALDLACVKNDVEALAARLIEIGFKAENVTVLKTGGSFEDFPTKANVETRFAAFLETLAPGDFVVVYLSGHGIQPTDSKESFFAPIDAKSSDPFATSVSIDKMAAALGESDARFRWLIVDACRNDPTNAKAIFKTRASGVKGLVDPTSAPDSVCLLQSCEPGKFSYEGGSGVGNGVFTLSLLEALDRNAPNADANGDGALAITEILSYVTKRTNELAFKHHGASQVPRWSGAEMTEFAVLDDLLIDGLTKAKWNEANALYREACVFRSQKKWREALAKIKKAREINEKREEYRTAEAEIQAQVDATVANEKRAEADKLAADAWTAFNKGGIANVREAVDLTKKSLDLLDSAPNRNALALFEKTLKELQTPKPPTVTPPQPPQRVAQNGGSTSGRTSTSGTGATSTGQTPNASGDWSNEYAAGTAKSLKIKGLDYRFHYCPAGTFLTGSPESEEGRLNDETQHEVTLTNGFWLLETEVTQAMWKSIMGSNPSYFSSSGGGSSAVGVLNTSNFPVEEVSWYDCQEFITKLNSLGIVPKGFKFRLPTEAEWEYACRAGTTGPYAGSSLDSLGWYGAFYGGNSGDRTHKVGLKCANPWGLYDMHGNVWEWCEDLYTDYKNIKTVQNPVSVTGDTNRVLRGGCWYSGTKDCRSANRGSFVPTHRYAFYGFRLALGREL